VQVAELKPQYCKKQKTKKKKGGGKRENNEWDKPNQGTLYVYMEMSQ
jgi:hypothetical protein